MLDGLKNSDDVLVLKLQEEVPFNELNQAIIQQQDHYFSSHFRANATYANLKNKNNN
jgi:hypothetical protein